MNVYYWRTWYKAVCGGKGGSEGRSYDLVRVFGGFLAYTGPVSQTAPGFDTSTSRSHILKSTVNEEDSERDNAERRRVTDHSTTGSGPRLDIAHRPRTDAREAKMGTLHRSTCTARHERHDGARSTRQMARVGPAAQLR